MKQLKIILTVLICLLVHTSWAAKPSATIARYKGTTNPYGNSWGSSFENDCYLAVLENKTGFMVLTSESPVYYAVARPNIRQSQGLPFQTAQYQGISNRSKSGEVRVNFNKNKKRMVPQSYLFKTANSEKYCHLQKRI